MKRIFLSFQMEDKKQVDGVRLLKWNSGYPFKFYDESVRIEIKSVNAPYIKSKISAKIQRCSRTICFLGQTTFQSSWVNWELEKILRIRQSNTPYGIAERSRKAVPSKCCSGANLVLL